MFPLTTGFVAKVLGPDNVSEETGESAKVMHGCIVEKCMRKASARFGLPSDQAVGIDAIGFRERTA